MDPRAGHIQHRARYCSQSCVRIGHSISRLKRRRPRLGKSRRIEAISELLIDSTLQKVLGIHSLCCLIWQQHSRIFRFCRRALVTNTNLLGKWQSRRPKMALDPTMRHLTSKRECEAGARTDNRAVNSFIWQFWLPLFESRTGRTITAAV